LAAAPILQLALGMPVLAAAGLRRVEPGSSPAWTRRKVGKGFVYLDEHGRRIARASVIDRIRKLAIPPAWVDVWICPDPMGHIQATGRDARGRLQYRYHPLWSAQRGEQKFAELGRFARALPRLRRSIASDLGCDCLCREAVLAAVVALIEKGHLRVGSEEYTRDNGSHGVTTLERRHVRLSGGVIDLRYRGKSGVARHVEIADPQLARVVARCLELPGRRVFKYKDGERVRRVTAADVNEYIRRRGGEPITAKYFRTWAASLECLTRLAASPCPNSATAGKRAVACVIKEVAQKLGHTPTVCRQSYVHPRVIERFMAGALGRRGLRSPRAAERAFVSLLAARSAPPPARAGRDRRGSSAPSRTSPGGS
jgi:DNA topoisomerase-1